MPHNWNLHTDSPTRETGANENSQCFGPMRTTIIGGRSVAKLWPWPRQRRSKASTTMQTRVEWAVIEWKQQNKATQTTDKQRQQHKGSLWRVAGHFGPWWFSKVTCPATMQRCSRSLAQCNALHSRHSVALWLPIDPVLSLCAVSFWTKVPAVNSAKYRL